jgi:hypothetical protein
MNEKRGKENRVKKDKLYLNFFEKLIDELNYIVSNKNK